MKGNKVFVLDIGTRNVVGLVAKHGEDNALEILDAEVIEHPERSIISGQIHDIPKVSKIIAQIKFQLETRLEMELKEVAVAAAGRALISIFGHGEMEFTYPKEVTTELSYALQLEAVRQAQQQIQEVYRSIDYHCVGFSVSHQYLDEMPIGNLVGQVGRRISVEVIATFLPRVVVDSLQSAIQNAGLEMIYLTLEPIAAMNLAVPSSMRQLNIALVDVGAGTSDIAIADQNTVKGYGMIPVAGDKITDVLCQEYLLDFTTSEEVKRQLVDTVGEISFKDITGQVNSYPKEEILNVIAHTVQEIAQKIGNKILEINGRPPQAVLCIGGGSLTPSLPKKIAQALELPENRIALIGEELAAPLAKIKNPLPYPQAITPLAIVSDALYHRILEILSVTVNGRSIRLFVTNKVTVGDALVAAGISPSQHFGRIGPALSLEVNGEIVFAKGTPGQMGKIKVNGQGAKLDTLIDEGSKIDFHPGEDGKPGGGNLVDFLPGELVGKYITVNNERLPLLTNIRLNARPVSDLNIPISDGDKIEFDSVSTIQELLKRKKYSSLTSPIVRRNMEICVDLEQGLTANDIIEITCGKEDSKNNTGNSKFINVAINGEVFPIPKPLDDEPVILTDIFSVIEFNPNLGKGKRLIMKVNNKPANFISKLQDGDQVIIKWE